LTGVLLSKLDIAQQLLERNLGRIPALNHAFLSKYRVRKSNQIYWEAKIRGNMARDSQYNLLLEQRGWRILRIWESSLRDEAAVVAKLPIVL
jgi:G:T-mismatch repair DNA endonuclease (very short patch repair protein)